MSETYTIRDFVIETNAYYDSYTTQVVCPHARCGWRSCGLGWSELGEAIDWAEQHLAECHAG